MNRVGWCTFILLFEGKGSLGYVGVGWWGVCWFIRTL